jgi:hypothetical protein
LYICIKYICIKYVENNTFLTNKLMKPQSRYLKLSILGMRAHI